MEPRETALDDLYSARDALDGVLEQMKKVQPADLVNVLSCYRVASVQILTSYTAFVDDLSHVTEQMSDVDRCVSESAAQMRVVRELLCDALVHAENSLPTIDQLRVEEAERAA